MADYYACHFGLNGQKLLHFIVSEKDVVNISARRAPSYFEHHERWPVLFSVIETRRLLKRFNNGLRKLSLLNNFLTNRATVFGHYSHFDRRKKS
jgi:hypothetical protein